MPRFLIILFVLFKSGASFAQQNDLHAAVFNVGISSVGSGFGALINKKPNEKGGRVFLRGMWQGAIGGILVFNSKQMIYEFGQTDNSGWAWSSKLVNAAGVSIIENAAANKKFLTHWHINFGFNRIEFETEKSFKVNYKVMPFALNGFIYSLRNGSFDFKETIRIGQPFFWAQTLEVPDADAVTAANSILMIKNKANSRNTAHEIVHTYQYQGLTVKNTYYSIPFNRLLSKENWFAKTYKKWIYTDFNYLIFSGAYALGNFGNYLDNPFEQEANYYSWKFEQ
ncbi:MAG: hypothetical protein ACOVMQ_10955 [Cyclobacteriaceae bacterium]